MIGDGAPPIKNGNQPLASLFIRSAIENGIEGNKSVTWKIHLRHQARGESRPKERDMNMCRAPGIVMIAPRIRTRPDRDEAIAAFTVRNRVTRPGQIRTPPSVLQVNPV